MQLRPEFGKCWVWFITNIHTSICDARAFNYLVMQRSVYSRTRHLKLLLIKYLSFGSRGTEFYNIPTNFLYILFCRSVLSSVWTTGQAFLLYRHIAYRVDEICLLIPETWNRPNFANNAPVSLKMTEFLLKYSRVKTAKAPFLGSYGKIVCYKYLVKAEIYAKHKNIVLNSWEKNTVRKWKMQYIGI